MDRCCLMIPLAHICSDQTLADVPPLLWITPPSPGCMLSCLAKWFTTLLAMWSKLCSFHFLLSSACNRKKCPFLGLRCISPVAIHNIEQFFSRLPLSSPLLSHYLSRCPTPSPFPVIAVLSSCTYSLLWI